MPYYSVKSIFYTLQGEGARTGRPAVFLRFAGCNLWNGLESGRAEAICQFCDTDFFGIDGEGGGRFATAEALAAAVAARWPANWDTSRASPYVVCTGGEPLLQLDSALIEALHGTGFEVAIETNGTLPVPAGVDWVCVSPKARAELVVRSGDELKLVFPQEGAEPEHYLGLDFTHFSLQPMDGSDRLANTRLALEYCLHHPAWRLSLQTHKMLGIP
ncbi:MAG TPA: 7-carboxy-7-deazaguanine synthase [Gemmatimonadales bacterium]|jgi:7-carboxy-7-deazaguanine synthase (Cx14CxxC type)|nr:7-carboxy-7-deazaguanine synthase [Gemmatimonadales bacterium]